MLFLAIGFALVYLLKNGLWLFAGFAAYWLINYWLIRGILEQRVEQDPSDQ